jgi:hypothetical protein
MARSLHTQKLELRAVRRLARPYSKRRSEAALLSGRTGGSKANAPSRLPIGVHRHQTRLCHPLNRQDISSLAELLGPVAIYGLKSIQLRREPAIRTEGIVFAEYALSADIFLYALPTGPWNLPFPLAPTDCAAFRRYGALVESNVNRNTTMVSWPLNCLKRYLLYEVLAHELGHHAVQRSRGKLATSVCRTRDHEALAERYTSRALHLAEERRSCE